MPVYALYKEIVYLFRDIFDVSIVLNIFKDTLKFFNKGTGKLGFHDFLDPIYVGNISVPQVDLFKHINRSFAESRDDATGDDRIDHTGSDV